MENGWPNERGQGLDMIESLVNALSPSPTQPYQRMRIQGSESPSVNARQRNVPQRRDARGSGQQRVVAAAQDRPARRLFRNTDRTLRDRPAVDGHESEFVEEGYSEHGSAFDESDAHMESSQSENSELELSEERGRTNFEVRR